MSLDCGATSLRWPISDSVDSPHDVTFQHCGAPVVRSVTLVLAKMAGVAVHVYGQAIDDQTRCVHWISPRDVVAIKMHCCQRFYPCYSCHQQQTDTQQHSHTVWPRAEWKHPAVMCGACKSLLSVYQYVSVYRSDGAGCASDPRCPHCKAEWNPGCGKHLHLYFGSESD